jgi:hypothetical protein
LIIQAVKHAREVCGGSVHLAARETRQGLRRHG